MKLMGEDNRTKLYLHGLRSVPEIVQCLGALTEGDSSDNSQAALYQTPWKAELKEDDYIYYFQDLNGWQCLASERYEPNARHIAIAFDQAARRLTAREVDETVLVKEWDFTSTTYLDTASFAGVDPCLLNDAIPRGLNNFSDIKLFYLSVDRNSVLWREQRDNFTIERTLRTYTQQIRLDQVVSDKHSIKLFVSDITGQALEAIGSNIYPFYETDQYLSAYELRALHRLSTVKREDSESYVTAYQLGATYSTDTHRLDADELYLVTYGLGANHAEIIKRLEPVEEVIEMDYELGATYKQMS